jgi:hypothetical protein
VVRVGGVYLMGVYLMGVYLAGVHPMGVYLINVHLTGVPEIKLSREEEATKVLHIILATQRTI